MYLSIVELEGVGQKIFDQGVLGALLVGALIVIGYLYVTDLRRLDKLQKEKDLAEKTLQDEKEAILRESLQQYNANFNTMRDVLNALQATRGKQ